MSGRVSPRELLRDEVSKLKADLDPEVYFSHCPASVQAQRRAIRLARSFRLGDPYGKDLERVIDDINALIRHTFGRTQVKRDRIERLSDFAAVSEP
jgi:hypothetical protein